MSQHSSPFVEEAIDFENEDITRGEEEDDEEEWGMKRAVVIQFCCNLCICCMISLVQRERKRWTRPSLSFCVMCSISPSYQKLGEAQSCRHLHIIPVHTISSETYVEFDYFCTKADINTADNDTFDWDKGFGGLKPNKKIAQHINTENSRNCSF